MRLEALKMDLEVKKEFRGEYGGEKVNSEVKEVSLEVKKLSFAVITRK